MTPAQQVARLIREADRVHGLLADAERRQGESWDKPLGVQRRIEATVEKHRAALRRIEAQIAQVQA